MKIDEGQLGQLRSALAKVGSGRPLEAMVDLAKASPANFRMVIDFEATHALGAPLVMLQPLAPSYEGCGLTPREQQVAALLADGLRNQQIAQRLEITVATVKDHVHRVLAKTGLSSRAQLAARRSAP